MAAARGVRPPAVFPRLRDRVALVLGVAAWISVIIWAWATANEPFSGDVGPGPAFIILVMWPPAVLGFALLTWWWNSEHPAPLLLSAILLAGIVMLFVYGDSALQFDPFAIVLYGDRTGMPFQDGREFTGGLAALGAGAGLLSSLTGLATRPRERRVCAVVIAVVLGLVVAIGALDDVMQLAVAGIVVAIILLLPPFVPGLDLAAFVESHRLHALVALLAAAATATLLTILPAEYPCEGGLAGCAAIGSGLYLSQSDPWLLELVVAAAAAWAIGVSAPLVTLSGLVVIEGFLTVAGGLPAFGLELLGVGALGLAVAAEGLHVSRPEGIAFAATVSAGAVCYATADPAVSVPAVTVVALAAVAAAAAPRVRRMARSSA